MSSQAIIGRKREQRVLQSILDSPEAKMVSVYGRRRVGKTYLIRNYFKDRFDFYFTGSFETPARAQLLMFHTTLAQYSKMSFSVPQTWHEAFEQLRQYLASLDKPQLIVFLDELPWMDTPKSQFLSAFSFFWNNWASSRDGLKLVICGSATTWMLNKIIGDKGGLYGRSARSIYLAPFTLYEVELFLSQVKGIVWNRYQMMETFMILGGIPYYLDMLDKELTFSQNIDNLFFRIGAPLRNEYDFLFRSLFKASNLYRQVVATIAKRSVGLTLKEIADGLGVNSGGSLSEVIKNLCQCDFIRKYSAFGKKEREARYQLVDMFCRFHLQFVSQGSSQDEHYWSNLSQSSHNAWSGHAFEVLCLHHISQIRQCLGITGVLTNVSSWSISRQIDKDGTTWRGAQIDLVLNRDDHIVDLCEMKFSNAPFTVTGDYADTLRERAGAFAHFTRCRKALHNILVTPHGLAVNRHSSIFNKVVVADDLFAPTTE